MYIILNLAIGGGWPGAPDSTTTFPGLYDIEYVRAYRRDTDAGVGGAGTSTGGSSSAGASNGGATTSTGGASTGGAAGSVTSGGAAGSGGAASGSNSSCACRTSEPAGTTGFRGLIAALAFAVARGLRRRTRH
jgi:MYXO-CTERM domain-containing protein